MAAGQHSPRLTEETAIPPSTKLPVILIADDEPDILESLRDLLEDAVPAQCVLANSGTQALEMLGKRPVDLILSDYKMPGLNGIQFLEQARQRLPEAPRILITAFPDLEVAIDAINQARVEAFLIKPLDPDQVVERVRQALATPSYTGAR
ncbi:MAG TPA: response regulator [Candidatus Thermoplasmatota archaeon]|nr:response regulator [Candidatus Thermoplasmatota archaeon]